MTPIHAMSDAKTAADTKDATLAPPTETPKPQTTSPAKTTETKAPEAKEPEPTAAAKNDDDDLDDLDDVLDDFASEVLAKPPGLTVDAGLREPGTEALEGQFDTNIAELIKDMKIEDPQAQKQFEDLVKQFDSNYRDDVIAAELQPNNFEHVMAETMERLKKLGETIDEKIKNDPSGGNPEDMLTQLLAGFGDKDMDMQKMLVDMLEQLSLKEVLYEPIKELNTKFPPYLKENGDKLDKETRENYHKQYELTNEILAIFDAPTYTDDDKAKREQVNALLELLQELGQPPQELVGDMKDFPGLGPMGGPDDSTVFDPENLPKDVEKQMEEACKQQ